MKFANSFERLDFHEISGSHLLGDLKNRLCNVMLCFTTPLLHENVVKDDPEKKLDRKEGWLSLNVCIKAQYFFFAGQSGDRAGKVKAFCLLGQQIETQDSFYFSSSWSQL